MKKVGIIGKIKNAILGSSFINHPKRKVEDEEIERLKEIKDRIKKIKTVEELEIMEQELVNLGIISASTLSKLRRKKRRKNQNNDFYERIRCNLETINKVIETGKAFKEKEKIREDQELIQNRDERLKEGGNKQKTKEEDRTRKGGGRSRSDR